MLNVKDIMTIKVVTFSPDTDIVAAARILLNKRINGAPVVDEAGRVVGVLCQSDLVAQQKRLKLPSMFTVLDAVIPLGRTDDLEREMRKISATTVEHAMTPDPDTVAPETPVDEVATIMSERKLYTLPVVGADGVLVGVVGKEDVLKTLVGKA
jgi:CBS-domain-containing membrane protein